MQDNADAAHLSTALLEGSGQLCLLGEDGRLQRPSRGLCDLLGRSREDLVGHGWLGLVHADDQERSIAGVFPFSNRMRGHDGQYHWLEWQTLLSSGDGQVCVVHDVTAHKKLARELTTELAVSHVLAAAPSVGAAIPEVLEVICQAEGWQVGCLWWVDRNTDQIRCQAMWHAPEILADNFEPVSRSVTFRRGESLPGYVWDTGDPIWPDSLGEDDCFVRLPIVSRNGLRDACAFPIRGGDEVVGVLEFYGNDVGTVDEWRRARMQHLGEQIGQFITQRQASEESQSGLRLFEADRLVELGSLASGLAHQINNALTYMRLGLGRLVSLELSRKPVTPVRLHRIELLQDVREGVARIERIVHELENFSCIDDGAIGSVEVSELLGSVLRVAAHEIRQRARLVCDYGDVPPVRGNEGRLRQVFLHLLINAAQAIPEGEADRNEISVTASTDLIGRVVITVSDTGVGIAPALQGRIFEPFFTTRSTGQGIGLGLSICHDTVAALGGEIAVDSVVGKGTKVRVILPTGGRPAAAREVARPATEKAASPPVLRGRILIVDDDRPVAAAVALELAEHDVVVAGSGREALHILSHDKDFDVILCDLIMPEVTGMDVYESIQREDPKLAERFAFMTGGAYTSRAGRFLADVSNLHIDKPFEAKTLHSLIHGLVEERARHRDTRPNPAPPPEVADIEACR